jgi:hypothetical protein
VARIDPDCRTRIAESNSSAELLGTMSGIPENDASIFIDIAA